jgi:hypothetical protein
MHWTSYLAYRRIYHPDAQIVGDLGCAGCGYNLRGLRVVGNCPECGAAIADSLYVLIKPALVAEALRSFANSYGTFFVLVIGCLGGFQGWQLIATAIILGFGALYRLWWAGMLHFGAELTNSAQLCARAKWMWYASIIEVIAWCVWVVAIVVIWNLPTQTAATAQTVMLLCVGWFGTALINALVAGWFGLALAAQLSYGWMIIEFRVQIASVIAALVACLVLPIAISGTTNQFVTLGLASVVGLAFIAAFVMTWTALQHAANAAERATDTVEDVLAAP